MQWTFGSISEWIFNKAMYILQNTWLAWVCRINDPW